MEYSKRLMLITGFLILTIFIAGCGLVSKEDSKEAQIKKSFEKTLSTVSYTHLRAHET